MELGYTKTEKAVGLFVLGIVLLLLTTVVMIGRGKDWFKQYVVYTTTFDESYGIQANTPVKLYKTDIGKVTGITLVGDRVELRLAVQQEYASRITRGTRATIESPTLIGSEYVSIKPGSISAPAIEPGNLIPSKPRRSLDDLLADFEVEKTARRLANLIENVEVITRRLAAPDGPLWRAVSQTENAAASLARISEDLEAGKGTAGWLLRSDALASLIEQRLVKLDEVIDPLAEAAGMAPPAFSLVQENLAALSRIQEKAVPAVDGARSVLARIDDTVASLQRVLGRIEEASVHAPPAARDVRETVQRVAENMEEIEQIVEAVRQNFLIRPHLPADPVPEAIDSGLRP